MGSFVVKILPFLLMFGLITSNGVNGSQPMHMKNNNGEEDHEYSSTNNTYKHGNQDGNVIGEEDHEHSNKTSTYNDFDKDETEVRGINDPMVSDLPNQACYTQFFVGGDPPTGLRAGQNNLRYICQMYNQADQEPRYGTMFDGNRGIAVFSAYKLTPADVNFQTEPQWQRTHAAAVPSQGSKQIYRGQQLYHKGHLVPGATYSSTPERLRSTFVYSNAVPQCPAFNQGSWAQFEKRIRKYAVQCTQEPGTLYLITGTAFGHIQETAFGPRYNPQVPIRNLRAVGNFPAINVPNSMWTAGCCVQQNGGVKSFAVIGNNLQNVPGQPDVTLTRQIQVAQLQSYLATDIDVNAQGAQINGLNVNLFPGKVACSDTANHLLALP